MTITVDACFVYPLKSGRALSCDSMQLTPRGPANDRLWLLVHDVPERRGQFITQRERGCGRLARIRALPEPHAMHFDAAGNSLVVKSSQLVPFDGDVVVWRDACSALDAGDSAARWFSDFMGFPCRLVKLADDFVRHTDVTWSSPGDQVSFADSLPLLVTSQASLLALRALLPPDTMVSMDRFRPNIVLAGAEPFEEDVLHELRIGEAVIEVTKPCSRCIMTTVDQASGESPSKEPLRTLSQTRRGKADGLQGVFFGQNCVPRKLGTVSVGDTVEVLSRRPMHAALRDCVLKHG